MTAKYDYTKQDAMAMPVTPVEPGDFDFARYEAFAAEADHRYARFLAQPEGIAVWQRVRVGEVFRDACRDMKQSLRWQLGGLTRAMDYLTDAPAYLEPWYGIGTAASAFGADYEWLPGQAPAVKPAFLTADKLIPRTPRAVADAPILRHTLEMIDYFLHATQGRVPMSWCDIQAPINVAGGLVDITQFLMLLHDDPVQAKQILSRLADEVIRFTKVQSDLIGPALARPGHGFASARTGTGIGLSTDNLIMVSPAMYADACVEHTTRIGAAFGGTAFHSCGDWGRWLPAVKQIPNLMLVDGAFSPQTDPAYNKCEEFREALAGTKVILHARIVGGAEEVLARVKRLWKPGIRLIVGTHEQDPKAQHWLYHEIHSLCS
jgi:hypothetical protein